MNQYDHLKNKLHNYKVELDKEKLWKNTSHAIPKRKRRPAVIVILFAGLVISAWLLQSNSLLHLSASWPSFSTTGIDNHDHLAQNQQDIFAGLSTSSIGSSNKPIEVYSSNLSLTMEEILPPNHITKSETRGDRIFVGDEQNESHQTVPLVNNFTSVQSGSDNEIIEGQTVQAGESVHPEADQGYVANNHQTENYFNTDHEANIPVDYLLNHILPISIPANSIEDANSHNPDIQPLKRRFLQSIQLVQGFGFSTMEIHSLAPESDKFTTLLRQKVNSLETLSTTATATVRLPEKFFLEAGFQLTRLSTVIDHEWQSAERIHEEGVTTIIIDENGIPQSITGSTEFTRTTHYHAKRFTAHQNADIVFALHRIIWNEQRVSLNAFVKGTYNLSYVAKGTILDNNRALLVFSKRDNPFRRNSLFAFGGGLQMKYQLDPYWNITSNLIFEQLQYQYKDENISVEFQHAGLSLGLGIGYVF